MKLRKKFNKVTAWILTCILFFTMAFSITSEAYGEGYTHAKQFKNCHIYNGIDVHFSRSLLRCLTFLIVYDNFCS